MPKPGVNKTQHAPSWRVFRLFLDDFDFYRSSSSKSILRAVIITKSVSHQANEATTRYQEILNIINYAFFRHVGESLFRRRPIAIS